MEKDPSAPQQVHVKEPEEGQKEGEVKRPERKNTLFGRIKTGIARLVGARSPMGTTPTRSDYSSYSIAHSAEARASTTFREPLNPELFSTKPSSIQTIPEGRDMPPTSSVVSEVNFQPENEELKLNDLKNTDIPPTATPRVDSLTGWTIDRTKFGGVEQVPEVPPPVKPVTSDSPTSNELPLESIYTDHVPFYPQGKEYPSIARGGMFSRLRKTFAHTTHRKNPLPENPASIEPIEPVFENTIATDGTPPAPVHIIEIPSGSQESPQNNNDVPYPDFLADTQGERPITTPEKRSYFEAYKNKLNRLEEKQNGVLLTHFKKFVSRTSREIDIARKDVKDVWESTKEYSLAYKKLPFKQKAVIGVGLAALGLASGTASLPLIISGSMRAMGFLGTYTAYIKIAQQKKEKEGDGSLDLRQHGSALLLASFVALTVPELFRMAGEALAPVLSPVLTPIVEKVAEITNNATEHLKEIIHSYHHPAPIAADFKLPEETVLRPELAASGATRATGTGFAFEIKPPATDELPVVSAPTGESLYGEATPNPFSLDADSSSTALNHAPVVEQAASSAVVSSVTPSPSLPTIQSTVLTPPDSTIGHQLLPTLPMSHIIVPKETLTSVISNTSLFRELAELTDVERTRAVANIIAEINPTKLGLPDNLWLTAGKNLDLSHIHDIIKNSTINGQSIVAHAKGIIQK